MRVTEQMRLEWELKYLEEEARAEEESLRKLEGVSMTDVIIVRNKKYMYMAELKQMIRNIKDNLSALPREAAS